MAASTTEPAAPAPAGPVRVQRIGAVTVLTPRGPLSGDAAGAFASRLAAEEVASLGRLVVDLSAVTMIDSLGLETLVEAAIRLEDAGVTLRLAGVSSTLLTVLEITGHADAFELHDDAEDAARSFL